MKKMKQNLGRKIVTVALAFILSFSANHPAKGTENLIKHLDNKFNTTFFTKKQEELYYLINQTSFNTTPPDTIPTIPNNTTTETQETIKGIDGNPFKIENGKLIFTDNSADVAQTNIHEAIEYYNNIKMTNVYKDISFSAIQVILNDETLTDNEKRDAITIIFELSMKQFGYMLSRIGGEDDGEREYNGDKTYITESINQLKSPNASKDNIAYFNTHEYLNE